MSQPLKLNEIIWTEKYRPKSFDDLIFEGKESLKRYISNPKSIPSFIFHSNSPGTGKTSTAKIIVSELGADFNIINASDERGIDTIREKIKNFAQSLSSNPELKRCIFLDEADGLTKQAQESMKALMEMYSGNCFFILSCNDLSKIIEPIRKGRCLTIDFSRPSKEAILARLKTVCEQESLSLSGLDLANLVKKEYPDIRSMILALQTAKIEGKATLVDVLGYAEMMKAIKEKNVKYIYEQVYSGKFDIQGFLKYYFEKLFEASDKIPLEKLSRVAFLLADVEKNWQLGVSQEMIFLANILEIMKGS